MHNLDKNEDDYYINKKKLEEQIISKIDDKVLKKSFIALNEKLNNFGIPDVSISFLESNSPFNSAFLSNKINNTEIKVDNLGSGVEMIISLLYLETLASLSKENIIIIIDEPELHLHPTLQENFIKYLKSISSEKQIILSTHSPYFFKNCCSDDNIKLLISENIDGDCKIKDSDIQLNTFKWSPSWGEINYYAYDLPTIEFFNELYGYLQEMLNIYTSENLDNYLETYHKYTKFKTWNKEKDGKLVNKFNCTIFTYIRHSIHHRENRQNIDYTPEEFKYSIDEMTKLIKIYSAPCPF